MHADCLRLAVVSLVNVLEPLVLGEMLRQRHLHFEVLVVLALALHERSNEVVLNVGGI